MPATAPPPIAFPELPDACLRALLARSAPVTARIVWEVVTTTDEPDATLPDVEDTLRRLEQHALRPKTNDARR